MALTLDAAPSHVPVRVTAHLRTGIGYDLPYGLDLAGILASRMRAVARDLRHQDGAHVTSPLPDTTEEDPEDMDLPLARCITAGADWHWAASCAIPTAPDEDPEPRTFYRVVDSAWAHRAADRPLPHVQPSSGPHRDMMMPAPVLLCPSVQWHAIGDPDRIEHLLRGILFLGRRRSVGEGRILHWEIETLATEPDGWSHIHAGEIVRPCPEDCAAALAVPYRLGWYALRPPSWHPDRLMAMAMTPEPEEAW